MPNFDELKGKAKKAFGDLTGNDKMQREGKMDEIAGKVQEAAGIAAEKVEGAIDSVKEAVRKKNSDAHENSDATGAAPSTEPDPDGTDQL